MVEYKVVVLVDRVQFPAAALKGADGPVNFQFTLPGGRLFKGADGPINL